MSDQSAVQRRRTFGWHDPAEIRALARGKSGLEFLRAMQAGEIPPPPVAELIGMQLELAEAGRVIFTLQPAEFHLNPNGVLHGGIAALICDTACGCAVTTRLAPGETCATLEIKVNYLRPVGAGGTRLECTGTVLHVGRRSALSEAKLLDSRGKLVAHATSTLMIFPPEDPHGRPVG
ncbi:MAG: PaaI family thioesterase [Thermoanaerobaculia bacterium]